MSKCKAQHGKSEEMLPWFANLRLVGAIADVQFWNESLSFDILKSITKDGKTNIAPKPGLFSWSTFKMKSYILC